ncbi:MAG: leucine-rich repeat domain-containing protein, partial [Eubacterium sp.]|nr:leucine-rich repeat domain-containing protein [Eubacterium sp.]
MKKIISIILSFVMLTSITVGLDFTVFAEITSGSCGENITYNYNQSTGVLTINGTGDLLQYNHGPTGSPFSYSSILSVVISEGITSIGGCAFFECKRLKNVCLPNSITQIGNESFKNCVELNHISLPDSLINIGSSAFSGCKGLKRLTIPNSVQSIDSYAFSGCIGITSINIPECVTSVSA